MLQVKRAGSRLKSRIVAEQSITKWAQVIEQLEDQVSAVMQEERCYFITNFVLNKITEIYLLTNSNFCYFREEMALRKAEMEANKVMHHSKVGATQR